MFLAMWQLRKIWPCNKWIFGIQKIYKDLLCFEYESIREASRVEYQKWVLMEEIS